MSLTLQPLTCSLILSLYSRAIRAGPRGIAKEHPVGNANGGVGWKHWEDESSESQQNSRNEAAKA